MSCYHPKLLIPDLAATRAAGRTKYKYIHDPDDGAFQRARDYPEEGMKVIPCGKCLGCRLDYSRRWADRMMLELEIAKKAVFITLTYNEEHVPMLFDDDDNLIGYDLRKEHVQLFMKNLRRDYDGKDGHPKAELRYYFSGEYGPSTLRPHYHAIIFGLGLDDFKCRIPHGKNELGQQYFELPEIARAWHEFDENGKDLGQRGFVLGSDVSWETCAYVARYVVKKAFSNYVPAEELGFQPEFNLMSRRPGIGAKYLDMFPECVDLQNIVVSTEKGAKKISIPSYYLDILKKDTRHGIHKYVKIRDERIKNANDKVLQKLQRTSLSYLDQLEVEEEAKKRSVEALKRDRISHNL